MAKLTAAARSRHRCARSWTLEHWNSLRYDAQAPDGCFLTKWMERQDNMNYRCWREPAFAVASERLLTRQTAPVKSTDAFRRSAAFARRVSLTLRRRQLKLRSESLINANPTIYGDRGPRANARLTDRADGIDLDIANITSCEPSKVDIPRERTSPTSLLDND
jgi:hypothetical protein